MWFCLDRLLPELQSRAPQLAMEACHLLQKLTDPMLNAFAAAQGSGGELAVPLL